MDIKDTESPSHKNTLYLGSGAFETMRQNLGGHPKAEEVYYRHITLKLTSILPARAMTTLDPALTPLIDALNLKYPQTNKARLKYPQTNKARLKYPQTNKARK